MRIKLNDVIRANIALGRLIGQQKEYNINLSYRLYKLKKQLDEVEEYIMDRLHVAIGEDDLDNITNSEMETLNEVLLESYIEEDFVNVSLDEVMSTDKVTLTVEDIDSLSKIFT